MNRETGKIKTQFTDFTSSLQSASTYEYKKTSHNYSKSFHIPLDKYANILSGTTATTNV